MNFKLLSLGLFSVATTSSIASFAPVAKATCVATDVAVQVSVRDRNSNAVQVNNVNQDIADDCFGNTATTTGTQTATGSGDKAQIRNSTQVLGGGQNPTGVETPKIKVPVQVQVDVPALPNVPQRR